MSPVDGTHDAGLRSWVESANAPDTDFPVQNLPLGAFLAAVLTLVVNRRSFGWTLQMQVDAEPFLTALAVAVVAALLAGAAQATLTSNDPYVTILDGTETFGDIAAGARGVGEAFFQSIVLRLARALRVKYASVSELLPEARVRTLARCIDSTAPSKTEADSHAGGGGTP